MAGKDKGTENHIKETAKRVFFKEGRFNATTQEIADAAGVNRTLLHYYFRSREVLLEKVLLEGQMAFKIKMTESVKESLSFRAKMEQLIDLWEEHVKEFPYLDAYLVSQVHNGSFWDTIKKEDKETEGKAEAFLAELENEMAAGRVTRMEPKQFLLNFISMVSYPVIMRPLLEIGLFKSKKAYSQAMANRKEAIIATLFR